MPAVELSIAQRYVEGLWRWRCAVLTLIAVAVVVLGTGVTHLTLASNYEIYFDDSNPQLEALQSMQQTFSRDDNILFAIAPLKGDVFTPRMLSLVGKLTTAAWQLPFSSRVSSITNYQHIESSIDEITVGNLIEKPAEVTTERAIKLRAVALGQPQLVGRLLSPNAAVTGVNVRLALGERSHAALKKAVRAARTLAQRVEREHPDVRLSLTGNAMLNAAFPEASVHDLTHLTPFMYLLITLGIWAFLRSLRGALLAMLSVVLASVVAMGCAGWLGIVVSSASVVAPTIVTTVVVAYSLHVLAGFLRLRAEQIPLFESVAKTLSVNFRPISIAALTTSVGF